jgi:hypothetical protein
MSNEDINVKGVVLRLSYFSFHGLGRVTCYDYYISWFIEQRLLNYKVIILLTLINLYS